MPIAIWSQQYETGHPLVDLQHKMLFDMVNSLHHAIISGHGPGQVAPVLKSLASYTIEHFKTEEGLMSSEGYPEFARHKKAHDDLVGNVKDLLSRLDAKSDVLPAELSRFLADWLNHHIRGEDMPMIKWLNTL